MAQPISQIVTFNAMVSASGVSTPSTGGGLFLTDDDTVLGAAGAGKVRSYNSLAAVQADFDASTEPVKAATAWFGREDGTPKSLLVGRWSTTAVATKLTGIALSGPTASPWNANNATFRIGGHNVSVDLSSANTFAAIATALQTALRALATSAPNDQRFNGCTVEALTGTNAMVLTLAGPDDIGFATTTTASGSTTDISAALGWTEETGNYQLGTRQEEAADALAAISALNSNFQHVLVDVTIAEQISGLQDTASTVATWCSANNRFLWYMGSGDGALTTNENTSTVAEVSALQLRNTAILFRKSAPDYSNASIAAYFSAFNWDGTGPVPTAKFKTLPGFGVDNLSPTDITELTRKRANFYAQYGNSPMLAEGVTTKNGIFIDTALGILWLKNRVETDLFALLLSVPSVPQTAGGVNQIYETVHIGCEQAVRNGFLAPGTASPALTSQIRQVIPDFNGVLTDGFLINVGRLVDQPQATREQRVSPNVKVWGKIAGSFHFISGDITIEP